MGMSEQKKYFAKAIPNELAAQVQAFESRQNARSEYRERIATEHGQSMTRIAGELPARVQAFASRQSARLEYLDAISTEHRAGTSRMNKEFACRARLLSAPLLSEPLLHTQGGRSRIASGGSPSGSKGIDASTRSHGNLPF